MFELGIDTSLLIQIVQDEGARLDKAIEAYGIPVEYYIGRDGKSVAEISTLYPDTHPIVAKWFMNKLNMADLIPLVFTPNTEQVTAAPTPDSCLVCNGKGMLVKEDKTLTPCEDCKGTGSKSFAAGS